MANESTRIDSPKAKAGRTRTVAAKVERLALHRTDSADWAIPAASLSDGTVDRALCLHAVSLVTGERMELIDAISWID